MSKRLCRKKIIPQHCKDGEYYLLELELNGLAFKLSLFSSICKVADIWFGFICGVPGLSGGPTLTIGIVGAVFLLRTVITIESVFETSTFNASPFFGDNLLSGGGGGGSNNGLVPAPGKIGPGGPGSAPGLERPGGGSLVGEIIPTGCGGIGTPPCDGGIGGGSVPAV